MDTHSDPAVRSHPCSSLEVALGEEDCPRPDLDLGADVGASGVQKGDPPLHMSPIDSLPEKGRHPGKLLLSVDAPHRIGVSLQCSNRSSPGHHPGDEISEIALSLFGVGKDPSPGLMENCPGDQIDPGIDLPDRTLLRGRSALFTNAGHPPGGVTENPAIAGGVVEKGRCQDKGVGILPPPGHQRLKEVGVDQGTVSIEHQKMGRGAFRKDPGGKEGLAGPPRPVGPFLNDGQERKGGTIPMNGIHREPRRRNNHMDARHPLLQPCQGPIGVGDERLPQNRGEDLGHGRPHPGPGAGGEKNPVNDHGRPPRIP